MSLFNILAHHGCSLLINFEFSRQIVRHWFSTASTIHSYLSLQKGKKWSVTNPFHTRHFRYKGLPKLISFSFFYYKYRLCICQFGIVNIKWRGGIFILVYFFVGGCGQAKTFWGLNLISSNASIATYQCHEGWHYRGGDLTATCNAFRVWVGPDPSLCTGGK